VSSFHNFTKEKISALAGDIIDENLGLESSKILELSEEIDIIINGAATTNFYERYYVFIIVCTINIYSKTEQVPDKMTFEDVSADTMLP
jgi:alcohol-forming fatty acyl-CoA reductase